MAIDRSSANIKTSHSMVLSTLRNIILACGLSALENIPERTSLSTNGISAGLILSLGLYRIPDTSKMQSILSISIAREYSTHITIAHRE